MTDQTNSSPAPTQSAFWAAFEKLPGAKFLKNQNIGVRLLIGFGILVILTLLSVGFSFLGSIPVTETINRTSDVRFPTALVSTRAQANLLRMRGDVRGYLALGEGSYRTNYQESSAAFEQNLALLQELSGQFSPTNQERLKQLQAAFDKWQGLPEQLFELRDDQLAREPAYRLMATDSSKLAGNVLIDINTMIEEQGARDATANNLELLGDMANFQGTFASMFSALRGYVTTRNRIYRQEYEVNLSANNFAWDRLTSQRFRLNENQQATLDNIQANRDEFLLLPDQIFNQLERDDWRTDLYVFSTEAVPLAEEMQGLLTDITADQQTLLRTDLDNSKADLLRSNWQILIIGITVLILGVALAFIFRENIAGPVGRLTGVAEQIRSGHLEAQADVEAQDEIGVLAETFNRMTSQLRQTLFQVRTEKKRADDLLNVVIPIGVELSSEKNFNRLLENMLLEAKTFCHADTGALYLRPQQADYLEYAILRDDAKNLVLGGTTGKKIPYEPLPLQDKSGEPNHRNVITHAALSGTTLNIADTTQTDAFDFSTAENGDGQATHLTGTSMLVIPLKNSDNESLGVMQLLDAHDADNGSLIPFDQNLQQMMESFSSLAAAALEAYIREQGLRQEIQQLRIEIDESKRKKQVAEIVETDFFSELQTKAMNMRRRRTQTRKSDSEESES